MKSFTTLKNSAELFLYEFLMEEFDTILNETKIIIDMPNFDYEDIIEYLDKNEIEWKDDDGVITVLDPVEEAEIVVDVGDLEESIEIQTEIINEASAKRKIVVRKGKRKIIFKCAPGMMKKSARVCVRRPGSQLRKLKLRSKRSARKARSKKNRANRRRKISLRKRATFGIKTRKKKR